MSAVQEDFERALAELWVRDGIEARDPRGLAGEVAAAFIRGGNGPGEAAEMLERSGVRSRWNRALRQDRARVLAARIRPLATEPLLDVLSGDGSVSAALADLGMSRLAATERSGDYARYGETALPPHVEFCPYSELLDLARFGASTALLSAVLHHEENPEHLLDALDRAAIRRWIVIENCVTAACSPAFHELADRFFNACLNEIGVPCGDQHRTLEEWRATLEPYGRVEIVTEAFAVPGIPFPYTLMTVDRP